MPLVTPPSALRDLMCLRAPSHRGLYASRGTLFRGAIFGRDNLEVAEDLLDVEQELAREIIITICWLQGTESDLTTEEQPGAIHHEYRRREWVDTPQLEEIFQELIAKWGGNSEEMAYYGSVDATPLFLKVVGDYCRRWGGDILAERLRRRRGESTTVAECVALSADWVCERLTSSSLGLLEWQSTNPYGLTVQVWKDSSLARLHADGSRLNLSSPVAAIEVQGLAYDGLMSAYRCLPNHPHAAVWLEAASALPERIRELFWRGDYLATAIDRNPTTGTPRIVEMRTSDTGAFLRSGALGAWPEREGRQMTEQVTSALFSEEFLTDVGIRCTSLRHLGLDPDPHYYQDPWTAWVKETYDIARGCERQGLPHLAWALDERILRGAVQAGGHREFFYVDPEGRVLYDPEASPEAGLPSITVTNCPEIGQAWSVSADLAIKRRRGRRIALPLPTLFEEKLLAKIPRVQAPRHRLASQVAPFTIAIRRSSPAGLER